MTNELLSPTEAAARIKAGAVMSIAGAADLMADLPKGAWAGGYTGPVTFGEVAYILLNQTLVKLDLAA